MDRYHDKRDGYSRSDWRDDTRSRYSKTRSSRDERRSSLDRDRSPHSGRRDREEEWNERERDHYETERGRHHSSRRDKKDKKDKKADRADRERSSERGREYDNGRDYRKSSDERRSKREKRSRTPESKKKEGRGLLDGYGYVGQDASHNGGVFRSHSETGLVRRTFPKKKERAPIVQMREYSEPIVEWIPNYMTRTPSRSPDPSRSKSEEIEVVPLFRRNNDWPTPPATGGAPGHSFRQAGDVKNEVKSESDEEEEWN